MSKYEITGETIAFGIILPSLIAIFLARYCWMITARKKSLVDYDKKGRELMKERVNADYVLLKQLGIDKGYTFGWGIIVNIDEAIATNSMVRDEVVIQRGQEPRGSSEYLESAREPVGYCGCCTSVCAMDYGSSEPLYTRGSDNTKSESCCLESCDCCRMYIPKDNEKTKDVKYVRVQYLNKIWNSKAEIAIRNLEKMLKATKESEEVATLAAAYANSYNQKTVATSNINIEMTRDTKPLVTNQVLSNMYAEYAKHHMPNMPNNMNMPNMNMPNMPNTNNVGQNVSGVGFCGECGAPRYQQDGKFCVECGVRFWKPDA